MEVEYLVNNAGYGLYGPIEGLTEEAVRLQLETNTVGMWRTCKAVLPGMRRRLAKACMSACEVLGRKRFARLLDMFHRRVGGHVP